MVIRVMSCGAGIGSCMVWWFFLTIRAVARYRLTEKGIAAVRGSQDRFGTGGNSTRGVEDCYCIRPKSKQKGPVLAVCNGSPFFFLKKNRFDTASR